MNEMESNETTTQNEQPKIASVGKTTTVNVINPVVHKTEEAQEGKENEGQNNEGNVDTKGDLEKKDEQAAAPEFTEEQTKQFFAKHGITYNGAEDLEKIKERLKEPDATLTEEQEQKAKAAFEKEILDLFIENGGTAEAYVNLKNLANADLKELSRKEATAELIKGGFDEAEAKAIVDERYYQNKLEAMEFDEDGEETKEEFEARKAKLQKKVDFFSAKLDNKASHYKTQAETFIDNLKKEISERKLEAQSKLEFAANVDKHLQSVPREQVLELGKLGDIVLPPVHYKHDESDFTEIADTLKDAAKFKQFLFNEDGSYNLKNLSDALLAQKTLPKIAREALKAGEDRMTKFVGKTFPHTTAFAVGVGGAPQKNQSNGKVASAGKPQRV